MYDPIGAYCARTGNMKPMEEWRCKEFEDLLKQDPLAYTDPDVAVWVADQGEPWLLYYALRFKLAKFLVGLFELKASSRCLDNEDDRIAVANLVVTKLAHQQEQVGWIIRALDGVEAVLDDKAVTFDDDPLHEEIGRITMEESIKRMDAEDPEAR